MSDKFYKTNGTCGSSIIFWVKDARGYTTDLENAHVYSRDEAINEVNNNELRNKDEFFINIPGNFMYRPLCNERVNSQGISRNINYKDYEFDSSFEEGLGYVAYKLGKYDGNHLSFYFGPVNQFHLNDFDHMAVLDYSFVWRHDYQLIDNGFAIIPKIVADENTESTLQIKNLDKVECLGR